MLIRIKSLVLGMYIGHQLISLLYWLLTFDVVAGMYHLLVSPPFLPPSLSPSVCVGTLAFIHPQ